MHKLERPQAPDCLGKYKHGKNNWNDVRHEDKVKIWEKLDEMQEERCAYCEKKITKDSGNSDAHIEHFRQRARYPQGTFEWSNIFGSCSSKDSCGIHKDNLPPYNPDDLIKMDEENPDDFFLFVIDGTIKLRRNLTDKQQHRAEETLRILNLNCRTGKLRYMRRAAVKDYLQTAEAFAEMALEFDQEEWRPLLEKELETIKKLPFSTAIRHILMSF